MADIIDDLADDEYSLQQDLMFLSDKGFLEEHDYLKEDFYAYARTRNDHVPCSDPECFPKYPMIIDDNIDLEAVLRAYYIEDPENYTIDTYRHLVDTESNEFADEKELSKYLVRIDKSSSVALERGLDYPYDRK